MGILDATVGQNPLAAAAVAVVNNIIQRVWPDPTLQAQAQQALLDMQQKGELEDLHAEVQVALAQMDVNKTEASNPNTWVAGWRPAIGWVGAASLACYYIPYAVASTVMWVIQCVNSHTLAPHPDIGLTDLIGLISSILGMGTLRSIDKKNGVDTKQIGT